MAPPTPAKLADVLDRYKQFAVYPPWSRPHTEETKYKLAWNAPVISDVLFSDDPDHPVSYRFSSDRAHVLPGEALTSWIEAWRGDDPSNRVPIRVVEAWVMITAGSSVFELDVEVHDPGEYTCEANLLTGDGQQAIAYCKEKPSWQVGPSKLSFQ